MYDTFDGDRVDLDFYVEFADELGAYTVLDVGCGTGCLAVRLAAAGRSVVALDPAEASLKVAIAKEGAEKVNWIRGRASALPELGADLAVMTGNVAQVFLTDDAWAQTLEAIARALRPGGHLAFETRRPELRAWLEWAGQCDPVDLEVPGVGMVQRRLEVTAVRLPYVSLRHTYRFASDGALLTSDSTLRFRGRGEVEADLAAHGYRVVDVRDAPDRPGREYTFVAQCPV
jgi:SAM-dependent methyltransferase